MPNVPRQSYFSLVEVVGEYAFEQVDLAARGWSGTGHDFGHRLDVRLITTDPIPVSSSAVTASIRTTLRTPSRFWNLDSYSEEIEELVRLANEGKVGEPESGTEKLLRIKQQWKSRLREAGDDLLKDVVREFRGEELEPVVAEALGNLYPGAIVENVGGANEHGADILLQIPNHFEPGGENGWLVLVQVKNWEGHANLSDAIERLIEGCEYWQEQRQQTVIAAVVVTTAESVDQEVKEEWRRLGGPEEVGFSVASKKDVAGLLADGFRLMRFYE